MKQFIVLSLALLFIIISCQKKERQPRTNILNSSELKSEFFTINNSKDTIIITSSGIVISIPKNSFNKSDNHQKVILEYKEAFKLEDIVLAGLTTTTNDQQYLESSGMFFLEAKNATGEIVELTNPIQMTLPNIGFKKDLMLFEGSPNSSGRIEWSNPTKMDVAEMLNDIEVGKQLFNENCAACHNRNLINDMTGPALGNIHLYREWNWLIDFTRNSQAMIASGNTTAICIWKNWNLAVMTSYENLSDKELNAIYQFIKNESLIKNITLDSSNFGYNCENLLEINRFAPSIMEEDLPMDDTLWLPPIPNAVSILYKKMTWANIDRFWKDPRMEKREFFVRVNERFDAIDVFIVFPDERVFIPSFWKKGDKYSFTHNEQEKMTTFPIGASAVLLVIGKNGEDIFFDKKRIIYGDEDIIEMSPQASSSELIQQTIKELF